MEWVSVKERLPEAGQRVIVYKPNARYEEARVQVTEWYFNLTMKGTDQVTDWCPITFPKDTQ